MSTPWPIVFMGTPQIAAVTLEQLIQGPDPVAGVVTQPDRPAGRGQRLIPSPVRRVAESHGIPVVAPEKIRAPEFLKALMDWKPEIIVVVAYGRILPKAILDLAPYGCLNVHYSLLPKYRGAAPAAWTIINGESTAGVTTMKLVEKMDAGPVYLQEATEVAPDETTGSLQAKLTPIGTRLLRETLRRLQVGSLMPQEQDESGVTFAPILKKEDGLIQMGSARNDDRTTSTGLRPLARRLQSHWRKVIKNSPSEGCRSRHEGESRRSHESRRGRSLGRHRLRLPWIGRSPVGKQKKTFRCRVPKRGKD